MGENTGTLQMMSRRRQFSSRTPHFTSRIAAKTCLLIPYIFCSIGSIGTVSASGDFDSSMQDTLTANATTSITAPVEGGPTSSPTIPLPPTISPTSTPTLPPHRQHNKCPLKARYTPPEITRDNLPPIVIGHRGASYNVPEHTLAGYRLALELGADYIEPDLVPTKDNVLVAIHSIDINITTNVESLFPNRRRNEDPDSTYSGYYVYDFTLEEIKTLRVRQRVEDTPARSRHFDGLFQVPTLAEIIDLLHDWNTNVRPYVGKDKQKIKGRAGLYAELKRPVYLREEAGIHIADLFLDEIKNNPKAMDMFMEMKECANLKADEYQVPPLVLQCFDGDTLSYLHEQFTTDEDLAYGSFPPPMVLLLSYHDCSDTDMWFGIRKMNVAAVGPDKRCLLQSKEEGMGRDFVNSAKEHELAVHAWTERLEVEFIDTERFVTAEEELRHLFCELEIDGIFAENVDVAVRVGKMGCPTKEEEEEEEEKAIEDEKGSGAGSTETTGGKGNGMNGSNQYNDSCYEANQNQITAVGVGCALFGVFIGSLVTYCVSVNCFRRRVRRGTTRRQVQIPTAEINDRELI